MAHITDVLKKPVLTEKSLALQSEENKYTFTGNSKPSSSSSSIALNSANKGVLVSTVPLPQSFPSLITPISRLPAHP